MLECFCLEANPQEAIVQNPSTAECKYNATEKFEIELSHLGILFLRQKAQNEIKVSFVGYFL